MATGHLLTFTASTPLRLAMSLFTCVYTHVFICVGSLIPPSVNSSRTRAHLLWLRYLCVRMRAALLDCAPVCSLHLSLALSLAGPPDLPTQPPANEVRLSRTALQCRAGKVHTAHTVCRADRRAVTKTEGRSRFDEIARAGFSPRTIFPSRPNLSIDPAIDDRGCIGHL
jgi:hypothetical protein